MNKKTESVTVAERTYEAAEKKVNRLLAAGYSRKGRPYLKEQKKGEFLACQAMTRVIALAKRK